jgi:hypothetical protein
MSRAPYTYCDDYPHAHAHAHPHHWDSRQSNVSGTLYTVFPYMYGVYSTYSTVRPARGRRLVRVLCSISSQTARFLGLVRLSVKTNY